MERRRIDLIKFRGKNSSLYTGRPQGEQTRDELNLDKTDSQKGIEIEFLIPKGTSSFNPSFYLGLLYKSLKKLGVSEFERKYSFVIEDENPEIRRVLNGNLEDGKRNAINTLEGKTGFGRFLNS